MSKVTPQEYRERAHLIRHYTKGFDAAGGYDLRKVGSWSSAQKASVTRYFNLVKSLSAKPHYIYRPRSKENLRVAKQALGVESYRKLKVGIIQVPSEGARAAVRITPQKQMKIKVRGVSRQLLPFEDYGYTPEDFALDPEGVIDAILEQENDFRYFTTMAGEFEVGAWQRGGKGIPEYHLPEKIKDAVMSLINAYNSDEHDPNDPNSHHYTNWMRGLIGYNFEQRKRFMDYNRALLAHREKLEVIDTKIMRGKTQIKRWDKDLNSIKRRRKISPKQRNKMVKTIEGKIKDKKRTINQLLYAKIKINQQHS